MVQSLHEVKKDNYSFIREKINDFNQIARNKEITSENLIKKYEDIVMQFPNRAFLLKNRSSFFTLEDVTDLEDIFFEYFNSKIYSIQILDIFDQLANMIKYKKILKNTFVITLKGILSSFLRCKSRKPIFLSLGITRDSITLNNQYRSTWRIHNFVEKRERIRRYLRDLSKESPNGLSCGMNFDGNYNDKFLRKDHDDSVVIH